ncbi:MULTISPECIES: acyl-CoA dehydrogenase family protein [Alteribacter]|nr:MULTISPECIES: acyl-CoA dehydrogenase family protein [Alteribacter]MBM7097798.1 acyl-CoA/acyl-ACP dehydrogenase [Alteribacter salitolerans]
MAIADTIPILRKAEELSKTFSDRAAYYDENNLFPKENFNDLKQAGFLALTVPKQYGGEGLTLRQFLEFQELIATGDGATALSLGWHLGVILEAGEKQNWRGRAFEQLCRKVVNDQILLNQAATESITGSPSRGGLPSTSAVKKDGGWVLNGTKSFTSMAVALDYSLVTARISGTDTKGTFLVDHRLPGVGVRETWDTISMRATKSDDLYLDHVHIKGEDLLFTHSGKPSPESWYLQVPAVYLGIATAARNEAVSFAQSFSPSTLPGPIKDTPEVQRKIGEIDLELFTCRHVLYGTVDKWEQKPEKRPESASELAATKYVVTNSANRVVDLAMRVIGARSLSRTSPLQRHFRDVRAGLHNPPSDDIVLVNIGRKGLG